MARAKSAGTDRRKAIVEAAVVCFNKNGVVGTTFTQIAKQARVDPPLISYYFPDFESLFKEVVHLMLEDLKGMSIDAIDEHAKHPKDSLLEYCKIPLLWMKKRPNFNPLWTFFYHLASYQDVFTEINNSIRRVGRERITLLLYRYQEHAKLHLHKDWTIDRLAYAIHTQITGSLVMASTETTDSKMAAENCENAVVALLDQAFRH